MSAYKAVGASTLFGLGASVGGSANSTFVITNLLSAGASILSFGRWEEDTY